jgi:hypothetical protein
MRVIFSGVIDPRSSSIRVVSGVGTDTVACVDHVGLAVTPTVLLVVGVPFEGGFGFYVAGVAVGFIVGTVVVSVVVAVGGAGGAGGESGSAESGVCGV